MRLGLPAGKSVLRPLLLAIISVCLYLPTLNNEFAYDDRMYVDDAYIHDASNFTNILSGAVLEQAVTDRNRPVQLLSLMIDSAIWGKNPVGYHLTNVLLHAGVAVLLVVTLSRILRGAGVGSTPAGWGAFTVGVLFAVHPLNSEAVCSPGFREDLLVALFLLLALQMAILFGNAVSLGADRGRGPSTGGPPGRATPWLLGVGCLLALLLASGAKETAVAGPPLLVVYWLLRERRRGRTGPWIALLVSGFIVVGGFFTASFALAPETPGPDFLGWGFLLKTQPRILTYYLLSVVWPAFLAADYFRYQLISSIPVAAAWVCVAGLLAIQLVLSRRIRLTLLGSALFWLALAPVCNLAPLFRQAADRFMYLPMVGLSLMLGVAVIRSRVRFRPGLVRACAVGVLLAAVALSAVVLDRQAVWRGDLSLWKDAVGKNPNSITAWNNLGFERHRRKEYAAALDCFDRAIQAGLAGGGKGWGPVSDRRIANSHFNRGNVHRDAGRLDQAVAAYSRAIQLDGRNTQAYINRGSIYAQTNENRLALEDCDAAIRLAPDAAGMFVVYNSRGDLKRAQSLHEQALQDYTEAIRLNPGFTPALFSRGLTYGDLVRPYQALDDFNRVIELDPGFAPAYECRAMVNAGLGNFDLAREDVEQCQRLGLKPDPAFLKFLEEKSR